MSKQDIFIRIGLIAGCFCLLHMAIHLFDIPPSNNYDVVAKSIIIAIHITRVGILGGEFANMTIWLKNMYMRYTWRNREIETFCEKAHTMRAPVRLQEAKQIPIHSILCDMCDYHSDDIMYTSVKQKYSQFNYVNWFCGDCKQLIFMRMDDYNEKQYLIFKTLYFNASPDIASYMISNGLIRQIITTVN